MYALCAHLKHKNFTESRTYFLHFINKHIYVQNGNKSETNRKIYNCLNCIFNLALQIMLAQCVCANACKQQINNKKKTCNETKIDGVVAFYEMFKYNLCILKFSIKRKDPKNENAQSISELN